MRLLARLKRTERVAAAMLTLLATVMAGYMSYDSHIHRYQIFSGWGAAQAGFLATLAFGSVPALVFGAPVHAWLSHRGHMTWYVAGSIGIAFGALCFVVSKEVGLVGMLFGGVVGVLTHLSVTFRVRPNNSSKPTPLRGAA